VITLTAGSIADGQYFNFNDATYSISPPNGISGQAISVVGNDVTIDTSAYGTVLPSVSSTPLIIWGWPGGFQEKDLDVASTSDGGTTILAGNYIVNNNVPGGEIPAGESLGGDTLPASLYRSSKPAFFGNLDWAPFDSTEVSPLPTYNDIPAAYRYINGNEDYLGGVSTPQFSPSPGTYGSTQNVTITCATSGATIYYTTNGDTPTTSSTEYAGAVEIAVTTTLKALAVKTGLDDSSVQSGTYTISSGGGTPSYNVGRLRFMRR
jgi:hypothetical protein